MRRAPKTGIKPGHKETVHFTHPLAIMHNTNKHETNGVPRISTTTSLLTTSTATTLTHRSAHSESPPNIHRRTITPWGSAPQSAVHVVGGSDRIQTKACNSVSYAVANVCVPKLARCITMPPREPSARRPRAHRFTQPAMCGDASPGLIMSCLTGSSSRLLL